MQKRKILFANLLVLSIAVATNCNNSLKELNLKKVTDYLYEATLPNKYNYFDKEVREYFLKYKPIEGLCTSVILGNKIGRNLDYFYTNGTQYIVRADKTNNRHASIGVSNLVNLENKDVMDGKYHDEFKILPFITMDGINDAGVYCNINVVKYQNLGPWGMRTDDESDDMCELSSPRLVLDNCSNLSDIIKEFDKVDFFSMGTGNETHMMAMGPRSATDNTITSVVFEFVPFEVEGRRYRKACCISNNPDDIAIVNNDSSRFYKINTEHLIMTNFNLWKFHPEYERIEKIKSILTNAMGFERYELIENNIKLILQDVEIDKVTDNHMQDMMKNAYYSKMYNLFQPDFWYSDYDVPPNILELAGLTNEQRNPNGDISKVFKGKNDRVLNGVIKEINNWTNRDRSTGLELGIWETLYTTVYDYKDKSFLITPHEGSIFYKYKL